MARYSGVVGYAVEAELVDGIWEDSSIVERRYMGDVTNVSRSIQNGSKVLPDLSIGHSVSVVADAYAYEHFQNIKYVVIENVRWTVTHVTVKRPRLILSLGGVYRGPED